jgi:hypothetical protein
MCSIKKLQRFSRPRLSGVRRLFLEAEDRLQFLPADRLLGHFALLRALDRRRIREGFRKCGAQRCGRLARWRGDPAAAEDYVAGRQLGDLLVMRIGDDVFAQGRIRPVRQRRRRIGGK